ncbi:sugar phosphate isomerase/epimerase family protein [Bremerella sp. T1]|uniref:sugar phosphate isomerase/epimerase family protein n=1 Tax=Bremerella sp. TYQ1 TaxID=3119568 RepID=UPI001CC9E14F|nr:TIM barrel protein [Bremerella volcania]UBM36707.1 sugar phosphate isomerase/epimerase [Bremerella volcania]
MRKKIERPFSRRTLLGIAVAAMPLGLHAYRHLWGDESVRLTGLGLVQYSCRIRRHWLRRQDSQTDLYSPLNFLNHCNSVGAGGMQASLGVMEAKEAHRLRDLAENKGLFVEAIVNPPRDKDDLGRFEQEVTTARDSGATAVRTVIMPGRRYEQFKSLSEFRQYEQRGQRMMELAVPIIEKYQVPFAIENHKDQRVEERLALLKHLDCEWIGACVDTGNSIALLDDPYAAIEAFAPYAVSVHLKDQALSSYADGFLLGDVPLGEGSLDLMQMVNILRRTKPSIHCSLELITRDALKVPCLTEDFWTTLPLVSGRELSRTLRLVRDNPAKSQVVSSFSEVQQLELEDDNVRKSLQYAGKVLSI